MYGFMQLLIFVFNYLCKRVKISLRIVLARLENTFVVILSLMLIVASPQISHGESGRRKHFSANNLSIASLGAGETAFSAYIDPTCSQYNPSLIAFFNNNAVNFSLHNMLWEAYGSSISAALNLGKKFFCGVSILNLSNKSVDIKKIININNSVHIMSLAGFMDYLAIYYGLNIKHISYDLHHRYAVDGGFSKDIDINNICKLNFGASVQNFITDVISKLKIDDSLEQIPTIYRFSSAFILFAPYNSTIKICADVTYDEDSFINFYSGLVYIIADKYALRVGYHPRHFTLGMGIDFYSFTFDYAADFSKMGVINRFGITYKWGFNNFDRFPMEQKFKEAKLLYDKKEYLRATDMLSKIIVLYPNCSPPRRFYGEIVSMMEKIAGNRNESDFGKLTYAKAYVAYYKADYEKAVNEWKKYIDFLGETEEIKDYYGKISTELKVKEIKKRETELAGQAEKILKLGIEEYNSGRWVQCVNKMEELKKFVSENNPPKSSEYCSKAKEYIDRSVTELTRSVATEKNKVVQPSKRKEEKIEKVEYDEIAANEKYTEGLVLYAQGKYFEAERAWEFTLRLNPNHQKAKIALDKLKSSKTG